MKYKQIDRRRVLRGVVAGGLSTTLGLPILDIMLNNHGTAYAAGEPLPQRFGVWYWSGGIEHAKWIPDATGANWVAKRHLEPFAAVKKYVTPVTGYNHKICCGVAHISGRQISLSASYAGNRNQNAPLPSLDQAVAEKWKGLAPFDTISAGVVGGPVYGQKSSWLRGGNAYNPHQMSPKILFNKLFGNFKGPVGNTPDPKPAKPPYQLSVLDTVKEDANDLMKNLGTKDKLRISNHLDHIRTVEKRVSDQSEAMSPKGGTCHKPAETPTDGGGFKGRNDAHADVISLAFACNLSRILTFEFTPTQCDAILREVNPAIKSPMHSMTHNEGNNNRFTELPLVLDFTMQCFATLAKKLQDLPEGDNNVLHNTLIYGTSEHADTSDHSNNDFPILLVGGAGGRIKHGIHHRARDDNNATRAMLTAMRAVGAPINDWGQGAGYTKSPIPDLLT